MSKFNGAALNRATRELPDAEAKALHYLAAITEAITEGVECKPQELAWLAKSLAKQDPHAAVILLQRLARWAQQKHLYHYQEMAGWFLPRYQFLTALPAAKLYSPEELESRLVLAELRGSSDDLGEKIALTLALSPSDLHRACNLATRWWAESYAVYDWLKNSKDIRLFRRNVIQTGKVAFPADMIDFLEEIGPGDMRWFFPWMDDFLRDWKKEDWPLLAKMVRFAYSQRQRALLENDRDIDLWSKIAGAEEDKYCELIGYMRSYINLFSDAGIAYKKGKRTYDMSDTLIFVWGIRPGYKWKEKVSTWFIRDKYVSNVARVKALRNLSVGDSLEKQIIINARMEILFEELTRKLGDISNHRMYIWPDDCRNWHWFLRSKKWIERLTEGEAQERLLALHADMVANSQAWSPRVQAALAQRISKPVPIRRKVL